MNVKRGDALLSSAEDNTVTVGAWQAETARRAIEDPLLECLAILARDNGRRTSVSAMMTGLPPSKEGFASPALFERAAERLSFSSRIVRRPLKEIANSPSLPCIVVLKGHHACILKSFSDAGLELVFPETPGSATFMPFDALDKKYDGYAYFVRGQARMDDRAGPAAVEPDENWFWGVIRRHKTMYFQVALSALLINIFAMAIPIFIMTVYDRILPNRAMDTLWVLSSGVTAVMIFDFLLKNLRAYFLDSAGRKADIRISANIFEHFQAIKMAERPPSSGVLADNMRSFETLRDFFTSTTVVTLVDFPFAILFVFFIWLIGGAVVVAPLFLMFAIAFFGYLLQKPLARAVEETSREGAYKSSVLIETLGGLETIKIQAAEGYNQRKWEEIVEQSSLTGIKARTLSALGINFTALAANLSTVGIFLYGGHLFVEGHLSSGALIACVFLAGRAMAPFAQVAGILTKFNQSYTALRRLDTLMQMPVERRKNQAFIPKRDFKGRISFKNVTFRYPGQTSNTLNKISLEIEPHDRVGIIGSVGSGKTTIQRLITNLYQPSDGCIEIDGIDVRQVEPRDLRRNIGVAQQDAYIFLGTVRDNIILGHEAVPEEAVLRAAELSGISEFMRGSALGLDSPVGERGALLSGGQRQAISIARALLYDPPILILDEPTASIDPKSEKLLHRKLAAICENKTVLLITHRTTLLGLVDKLALLDKGQLVDYGLKDKVIKGLQAKQYQPVSAESEL